MIPERYSLCLGQNFQPLQEKYWLPGVFSLKVFSLQPNLSRLPLSTPPNELSALRAGLKDERPT